MQGAQSVNPDWPTHRTGAGELLVQGPYSVQRTLASLTREGGDITEDCDISDTVKEETLQRTVTSLTREGGDITEDCDVSDTVEEETLQGTVTSLTPWKRRHYRGL
ncbi:unnamed protein product [Arctogadus glacialis]